MPRNVVVKIGKIYESVRGNAKRSLRDVDDITWVMGEEIKQRERKMRKKRGRK
jgi:hypothetical protein